jgi:hypothetical protein
MANKRACRWDDEVDPARTINWFRTLCEHFGEERPRHIQRALDSGSLSENAYGKKIANSKFKGYAEGKHVPGAALVKRVDLVVKRSSWSLTHVLWRVLRSTARPIEKDAKGWVRELVPEIQSIVFTPDYELRLRGDRHYLGSLERRASVDALAALTILLILNIDTDDQEQAWNIAHSIFKVLLIIGPELDEQRIAERVFDLYVVRIFSLVSCDGMVIDLEKLGKFSFPKIAHILGGLAERLRQQHGSYRDRKMPSFYALQILNGQQHDLKDLLRPPVKPLNAESMPTAS